MTINVTFVPAIPDEDGTLFLAAVRPTTEMAMTFCALLRGARAL